MPGVARANATPRFERDFSLVEICGAEVAFITGPFGARTPVVEIDGRPISDSPGPVTMRIHDLYNELGAAETA